MKRVQSIPFGTSQTVQPLDSCRIGPSTSHEIYEARGREHGHDLDDWPIAESEVTRNFTCPASANEGGILEVLCVFDLAQTCLFLKESQVWNGCDLG